jgi:hypothetical protein
MPPTPIAAAREALAAHDENMKQHWSWKDAEHPEMNHLRACLDILAPLGDDPASALDDIRYALQIAQKYVCVEGTDEEIADVNAALTRLGGA